MSEASPSPSRWQRPNPTEVADMLSGARAALVGHDADSQVGPELVDRVERAISAAVAALAVDRAEAAPAIEAHLAGAAPRLHPPLARDLLLAVELMTAAVDA